MSKYEIGSITVYGNAKQTEDNPQGLGSYLVLTGMGCDEIFRILDMNNETFGDIFKRCEHWFQDKFHFTRLDVAIDDKNEVPYFTVEQLIRKCDNDEFISNSNCCKGIKSKDKENPYANTLYIGVGKSDLSYRIYDKDLEFNIK